MSTTRLKMSKCLFYASLPLFIITHLVHTSVPHGLSTRLNNTSLPHVLFTHLFHTSFHTCLSQVFTCPFISLFHISLSQVSFILLVHWSLPNVSSKCSVVVIHSSSQSVFEYKIAFKLRHTNYSSKRNKEKLMFILSF